MSKKPRAVSIEDKLYDSICDTAKKHDMTFSAFMRFAARMFIKKSKEEKESAFNDRRYSFLRYNQRITVSIDGEIYSGEALDKKLDRSMIAWK